MASKHPRVAHCGCLLDAPVVAQHFDERVFIDDGTAREIEEDAMRGHGSQNFGADDLQRVAREGEDAVGRAGAR